MKSYIFLEIKQYNSFIHKSFFKKTKYKWTTVFIVYLFIYLFILMFINFFGD